MGNDLFPGAKLMQLTQWGFPTRTERGALNPHKAFSVIHITGNSRLPTAEGECAWRQSLDPNKGNSATFFVNRDGSVVQALGDPLHMDPWSNGDLNEPDKSNPRIKAVVDDGVNPNQRTLLSIENVGFEPEDPITDAQVRTCGQILRYYHAKADMPVTRESVIGHYQINSVTRPNCPARDKSVIDRIVAAANEEDPQVIEELKAKLAECRAANERKDARIAALTARRDALTAALQEAQLQITELDALTDLTVEQRQRIRALRSQVDVIKAKVAALATDVADD